MENEINKLVSNSKNVEKQFIALVEKLDLLGFNFGTWYNKKSAKHIFSLFLDDDNTRLNNSRYLKESIKIETTLTAGEYLLFEKQIYCYSDNKIVIADIHEVIRVFEILLTEANRRYEMSLDTIEKLLNEKSDEKEKVK